MFLIFINTEGKLRHKIFKNAICTARHKGCELQKVGVTGRSLLYNPIQLINIRSMRKAVITDPLNYLGHKVFEIQLKVYCESYKKRRFETDMAKLITLKKRFGFV
jgi:hypothetical protein